MKKSKFFIVMLLISVALISFSCKKEKENLNYTTQYAEKPTKNESKVKELFDNNSYWFVVWEVKGKGVKVNSFIKQEHKGFSMREFKKNHGKDTFVNNLVEVSYDTYLINEE